MCLNYGNTGIIALEQMAANALFFKFIKMRNPPGPKTWWVVHLAFALWFRLTKMSVVMIPFARNI